MTEPLEAATDQLPQRLDVVVPMTTSFAQHQAGVGQTWKAEGFPSEEMAALICQDADPNTAVAVRMSCLQNLRGRFDWKHPGKDQDEGHADQRFFSCVPYPLVLP